MSATAEGILAAYEKFIESEERRQPQGQRQYVYASSWAACTRQMALDMLRPDIKPPFQADTLANFRRGNDRARDIKADFTRVGRFSDPPFDVIGAEERFELRDKKGRIVIVGKVDFRLKYAGQKGSVPVETKSYHPNLTQGVKRFEDMFGNRWLRKGGHQLLCYLYGSNEPKGIMLLDRPGIPRPLEVNLYDHLDKIEDFLQRAEIAMDAREKWMERVDVTPPSELQLAYLPPFTDDPSECRVCPFFGSACNPPMKFEGASLITDETILAAIEQHESLDEPRKEYKDVHEQLAEHLATMTEKTFKAGAKKQIIAGKYLIESTWQKQSKLDLPKEVEKGLELYRKTDEAGKFSFKIVKASE